MWLGIDVFAEDMEHIVQQHYIDWNKLDGSSVFITGGTGLIGYYIILALVYRNINYGAGIKIYALVRSIENARSKYSQLLALGAEVIFIEGSVENMPDVGSDIDYIIHGANPTASSYFVEKPVETIGVSISGTTNMLELARIKKVKKFVYLSSMEVYGNPHTDEPIYEDYFAGINTMSVRSSYPEAKRLCECLCAGYAKEYGVPAIVLRLAQTLGPGVTLEDGRVFAEFARCVINKENIVLKTQGESKRCYLYLADAVTGILTALSVGCSGEAYNVSNNSTYCSIYEMAKMVSAELAGGEIGVEIRPDAEGSRKYNPPHHLNIISDKLEALGWKPAVGLMDAYKRMIAVMEQ